MRIKWITLGLGLALLASAGCRQRVKEAPSLSLQDEVITPTGDYWTEINLLKQFFDGEASSKALHAKIEAANEARWKQAVTEGRAFASAEEARDAAILTSFYLEENNANSDGDEWGSEASAPPLAELRKKYDAKLKDAIKNFDAWVKKQNEKAKDEWWAGTRERTAQDFQDSFRFRFEEHLTKNYPIFSITWQSPGTYSMWNGVCTWTIRMTSTPSFSYEFVPTQGKDIHCYPDANSFGGVDQDYTQRLTWFQKGIAEVVARGQNYKFEKTGNNLPFYTWGWWSTVGAEETSDSFKGCKIPFNSDATDKIAGEIECGKAFKHAGNGEIGGIGFNRMTQVSFHNPRLNDKPISFTGSDLVGVCQGPLERQALGDVLIRSVTKTIANRGQVVADINRAGQATFRRLTASEFVIRNIICYEPKDIDDGQLPGEAFCQLAWTDKGARLADPRYYYANKPLRYDAATTSGTGLCYHLGYKTFKSWETQKVQNELMVQTDERGIWKNTRAVISGNAVKSVTCADPRPIGAKPEELQAGTTNRDDTRGTTNRDDTRGTTNRDDTRGTTDRDDTRGTTDRLSVVVNHEYPWCPAVPQEQE